jgi:hypothetical protein
MDFRYLFFVFLYGIVTMTGLFLCAFWANKAVERKQVLPRIAITYDRYFWLSTSMAIMGLGLTVLFGGRTYMNATHGLSGFLKNDGEAIILGAGLVLVFVGQGLMVWLADLENNKPMWLIGMAAITLIWAGICIWLLT